MRGRLIVLLTGLLAVAPLVCAQQSNTVAAQPAAQPAANSVAITAEDPAYAKLEARLNGREGVKRAEVLAQLAVMDYDAARARYVAGDVAAGEQLLQRARTHAAQAYAIAQSEAEAGKTKGLEKVEMPLHSISYGLRGLAYDVTSVNRPPIQGAEAYFNDLRAHILELMFAPKTK